MSLIGYKLSAIQKTSANWYGSNKEDLQFYKEHGLLLDYIKELIEKHFKILEYSAYDYTAYVRAFYEKSKGKFYLKLLFNDLNSKFSKDYSFKYKQLSASEVQRADKKFEKHYETITVNPKDNAKFSFIIKYDYNTGKYRDDIYDVSLSLKKI
jgi:integrase